jgi:hypothetical protein
MNEIKKYNEFDFMSNKDIRNEYINRIEILEKVKQLLLLPDINLVTREQVANYYEVNESAIRKIEIKNRDEIDLDGFKVFKMNDFKERLTGANLNIKTGKGCFEVEFSNDQTYKIPYTGIALYTPRAILRIGMLLQESNVAKEVRTQLLNIEEKSTTSQRVESITEEQELILKIIYAKDDIERANATSALLSYKNKRIDTLENKVEALVEGNLSWNSREAVNRMVRLIAYYKFNNKFNKAWDKVCGEMLYAHNIGITRRKIESGLKHPTIFDVITDNEMKLLVQSCLSLCERYQIDTNDLMIKNVG